MAIHQNDRYSLLLTNFRQLPSKKQLFNLSSLIDDFKLLLEQYSAINARYLEIAKLKAPEFNVFNLLGVTRDEVRTHSSLLGELLNPKGTHGQGCLFVKSFFDKCLEKEPENIAIQQITKNQMWEGCSVSTEFYSPYGRMDIAIRNPAIGFFCVVENKIDAVEQSTQLKRYKHYMESVEQNYPLHSLVFLTKKGSYATSASPTEYIRLSYQKDITMWLYNVLPLVEATSVKEVVLQYIDIVRNL